MLAVSGGIDSLAMSFLVGEHNRRLRRPLEISAMHVRVDSNGATSGLPEATVRWMHERGIEVLELEARLDGSDESPLDCFARTRARRRTLLEAADARGAHYVALGHHADDVVEIWLLGLMYTGRPDTIPAIRSYFDGAVTVVRPLYEMQRGEISLKAAGNDIAFTIPVSGTGEVWGDVGRGKRKRPVRTQIDIEGKLSGSFSITVDSKWNVTPDLALSAHLSKAELNSIFDYGYYLKHVDEVFERLGLSEARKKAKQAKVEGLAPRAI